MSQPTHAEKPSQARLLVPPIDLAVPDGLLTATFGNGCFWAPDARFGLLEGVWRTRVGYAGGELQQPTYRTIGDHTECFQVDYDPSAISYDDLLELFWQSHEPTMPAYKTQYASLILANDDEQLARARESAERYGRLIGAHVVTRIEPLRTFWLAEAYHQKYHLRQDRLLMAEFRSFYPHDTEFIASTAAARANGYLYGGQCTRLERDLPQLGLSQEAADHLRSACR
jgi:methionine-S-sulfoxide reductase